MTANGHTPTRNGPVHMTANGHTPPHGTGLSTW